MAYFEKYTFNALDKDTSPSAVSSDGQRKRTPGTAFHMKNVRVLAKESGKIGSVENIRGNELIVNGNLPSTGTNKVVGSIEDIENNSMVYLVHNSSGNHTIQRYYPDTGTFKKILEWSGLNFSGKKIKGIGIAGQSLYWAEGTNEVRTIQMKKAEEGAYSALSEVAFTIVKTPPSTVPTVAKATDTSKNVNRITADSFQFAYRYQYFDNANSVLSPFSKGIFGKTKPETFDTVDNRINVGISISSSLRPYIKRVELFFRKNNGDTWYFFHEILNPSSTSYSVAFYNDYAGYPLANADVKTEEPVPSKSGSLAFFKDRVFITNNTIGLDVNDASGVTVALSKVELAKRSGLQFKENGIYSFGIKYSDGSGRNTLVKQIGTLNFKNYLAIQEYSVDGYIGVNDTLREYAKVTISGTAPSWATKAEIVMTKEKHYSQYMQFAGFMLFAKFPIEDLPEGESIPGNTFTHINGYVYDISKPDSAHTHVHVLCPYNLPIVPTSDMYIRIISSDKATQPTRINEFFGDRISFNRDLMEGSYNWEDISGQQFFEVFTLASDDSEEIYYETGQFINIPSNKIIPTTDVILEGDTHVVIADHEMINAGYGIFDKIDYYDDMDGINASGYKGNKVESPTPVQVPSNEPAKPVVYDLNPGGYLFFTNPKDWVLDYQKISNHFGRAFSIQREAGQANKPNEISFSDPYIQDTQINGLSNFSAVNRKSIPNELSKLTALVSVGNNIMLAVHERESTSMAIGEGFIKTGDSTSILTKTEGVIGDDRQLLGSYGTIYPGSLQSHMGRVYGFDIYKGVVWRYTVEGLFPISKYGMESKFLQLAKDYLPYKDQVEIIAGIDPYYNEYLITFPPIGDLPGETWGFNFEYNIWTSYYDFIPDYYGKVGNRLYTFKDGQLYEHNKTSTYNNFYGAQQERSITFYANPAVTKNKRLLNVHIIADKLSYDPEYKVVVIRTESGQESYIRAKWFEKKEGTWYAEVLKNINSVGVDAGRIALRDGEDMRDKYFEIEINSDRSDRDLLHEISLVFVDSEYSR